MTFAFRTRGQAVVWQIAFFVVATDPIRFRPLIAVSVLEKLSFFSTCLVLFLMGRLAPGGTLLGATIDAVWMILFAIAWGRTPAGPMIQAEKP